MILPRIVGVLGGVTGAVRGLGAAFSFLGIASGGILPALGIVVAAFAALYAGAKGADTSVSGIMGVITSVTNAAKPLIEGFAKLFKAMEPVFVEFGNVILDTLVPVLKTAGEVLGWLSGQLAEVLSYLRSIPVTLPGGRESSALSVGARIAIGPLGWASLIKDMITGPAQEARIGPSGRTGPLASSFGLGGGGKSGFGSIESGWQQAMMAGMRSPAAETAENTGAAKVTLTNILSSIDIGNTLLYQYLKRSGTNTLDSDMGLGFEGGGADW